MRQLFLLLRHKHGDYHSFFGCSDYFTENFQVKENKTKMRNIHSRFFQLLFYGLRLGFRLGFGLRFDLGIVL